jgi:hypothetical protein
LPVQTINKAPRGIIAGDLCAGNVFLRPVRILGAETTPAVSAPPGNPRGFQAREVPSLRIEKTAGVFDALNRQAGLPLAGRLYSGGMVILDIKRIGSTMTVGKGGF